MLEGPRTAIAQDGPNVIVKGGGVYLREHLCR